MRKPLQHRNARAGRIHPGEQVFIRELFGEPRLATPEEVERIRREGSAHGHSATRATCRACRRQRFARIAIAVATGASFAILFLVIATDWRL